MNLENEIQRIINLIDPTWNELEKVRFVYIEVGKIIEKNTEFFFTQSDKLQRNALSEKEMSKINNVTKKSLEEDEEWYRVICRSAAVLLKEVYDRINIPCHLIKSVSYAPLTSTSNKKVFHWRLSVDINNTHYSLILASDLYNIKNGFATEHFATRLDYKNAKGIQLYQGKELDFSVLSYKELEAIDKKIGYINTYYPDGNKHKENYTDFALNRIRIHMRDNYWYYEIASTNLPMYENTFTIIDGNGNKSNITSLDPKTVFIDYADQLIKNMCIEVEKAIKSSYNLKLPILKYQDYESWLKAICIFLEDDLIETYGDNYLDIIQVNEDFDFKSWRKKQKKILKCPYKSYDDNLELLDQIDTYVSMIRILKQEYKEGSLSEQSKKLLKKFKQLHLNICQHFLPDLTIFEKNIEIVNGNPYVKSDYINEKFKTMFPIVFDIDGEPKDFNKLGYSEQIAAINKLIPNIFPEITPNNINQIPNYSRSHSASLIRIRSYCILNEKTNQYELIFHIPSFFEFEDEFYYLYKLKENTFEQIDIIEDVYNKKYYEILSSTLKDKFKNAHRLKNQNRFRDIEEVESLDRPYTY